ncbi:hypothetical protein SAMN05216311_117138 [Chitinophaga sp. CF418]|nr:hypothetical protein SAMN05216311_117138 [Chitinophaga sp. CF418]
MDDDRWTGLVLILGGLLWVWLALKLKNKSKPWRHFKMVAIGLTAVLVGIVFLFKLHR